MLAKVKRETSLVPPPPPHYLSNHHANPSQSLHLSRRHLPSLLSCRISTSHSSVWRCGVCSFELVPNTAPLEGTYFGALREDVHPGDPLTDRFNFHLLEQSRKRGCRTCKSVEQVLLNYKHPRPDLRRDEQSLEWRNDKLIWHVMDHGCTHPPYKFNLIASSVNFDKDNPSGQLLHENL